MSRRRFTQRPATVRRWFCLPSKSAHFNELILTVDRTLARLLPFIGPHATRLEPLIKVVMPRWETTGPRQGR